MLGFSPTKSKNRKCVFPTHHEQNLSRCYGCSVTDDMLLPALGWMDARRVAASFHTPDGVQLSFKKMKGFIWLGQATSRYGTAASEWNKDDWEDLVNVPNTTNTSPWQRVKTWPPLPAHVFLLSFPLPPCTSFPGWTAALDHIRSPGSTTKNLPRKEVSEPSWIRN